MNKEQSGKFIAFEGGDGSGKTTMVARLGKYLSTLGYNIVETREPGGMAETLPIRQLLFDQRLKNDGVAQLFLFAADRRAHLLLRVIPEISKGKLVISDRFYLATRVYQGEKGVDPKDVLLVENLAITFDGKRLEPNLGIILDVTPEVGVTRSNKRGETNHFDEDPLEVHGRRREAYLRLGKELGWEVIDTSSLSEDEVFEKLVGVLKKKGIIKDDS